jgi:hypothetical protein
MLNGRAATANYEDHARYVPELAAAAKRLLELELVEMYIVPVGVGETSFVSMSEALTIVANGWNWGGGGDNIESGAGVDERAVFYCLITTDTGDDVVRSRRQVP